MNESAVKNICNIDFLIFLQARDLHYIGVLLAVTCCIASGLMDVLVAKCSDVSTAVLVNWSSIAGFVIAVIYCEISDSSYILSPRIYNTTWSQWATFIGKQMSEVFITLSLGVGEHQMSLCAKIKFLYHFCHPAVKIYYKIQFFMFF